MLFKGLFIVCFFNVCCMINGHNHGHYHDHHHEHHAADCHNDEKRVQLTLCQEFQLIRDLAPRDAVIRLVQSHMGNDIRFRKAVQYMRSADFKRTTAKIDATATFQSILTYLITAGVNTTDINSVGKIFDCILIPILEPPNSQYRSSLPLAEHITESRSLGTFVQEVSNLISAEELISTLEDQLAINRQFAEFYEVFRDPAFRSKVMQGFINRDISRPIKTLRRYQIDLSKLVEYAFNLLYLGPAV